MDVIMGDAPELGTIRYSLNEQLAVIYFPQHLP